MSKLRVAFIGTGRVPEKAGPMGYAMAYSHADGYLALPDDVEMVAAADIRPENSQAFAERYGFSDTFTDYHEMLQEVKPDLVSICTWPHLHAEMIIACAEAGVSAVHCEKPVADKFGDAKRCVTACEEAGTKLTFAHQRRYGKPFATAHQMIHDGAIGTVQKIEIGVGDLFDYGSHNFDMANWFNDEDETDWVLAGIDYSKENLIFGAHNENHALALWRYENGVFGLACTGDCGPSVGCHHRIIGSDGIIEIRNDTPVLRVLAAGKPWQEYDCDGESCHGPGFIERCIADVVDSIKTGRESMMNGRNALRATEQIFACWESVRRRGMVHLPLDIEDNPLTDMVERGELQPAKE